MPEPPLPTWRWTRFADLSGDDVYDLLALRSQVFVLEQACVYLDPDGIDRQSWHLLGRDGDGALRACLRVVDAGVKYDEPSIGRVTIAPAWRGLGLGHVLMAEGLRRCDAEWPRRGNRINAQAHLQAFYGQHGYGVVGAPYLEDGIVHVEMLRPAG